MDYPGGMLITNPIPEEYAMPADVIQSAIEQVGKAQTANIVSVAVVNKLLDLVPPEVLKEAVAARIPKGTEAANFKALEVGMNLL